VGKSEDSDLWTRRLLAFGLVGASIVAILALSIIAIATAGASRAETSRLVFSAVLPLLGTWVGTVLAFYFARENLQAATESTLRLAGISSSTPVTEVMIKAEKFHAYDLGTDEAVESVALAALKTRMYDEEPPYRRLPIRAPSGAVLYVLHDSTLTAYAEKAGEPLTALTGTFRDLLDVPRYKEFVSAIGFVSEKASVDAARAKLSSVKDCNDVFVTENGKSDERAIGWLTNTLLAGVQ
jgi:hypothetical protein